MKTLYFTFISHLLVFSMFYIPVQAQYVSRFAVNSSAGASRCWNSVQHGACSQWTNSISFVPHRFLTIELENEQGKLNGRNRVVHGDGSSSDHAFSTSYGYWGGNLHINLFKLFAVSRKPKRVIPYLYGGAGYMSFKANRLGNYNEVIKRFSYNVYTTKVGVKLRIKINEYFDCLVAAETICPQSFYVDANPVPKGYDMITSLKIGLSYKVASKARNEYIDWRYHGRKQPCASRFY